jgi:hypothetical protein
VAVTTSGKPYTDEGDVRSFDVDASQDEFVWHRDLEDRSIYIVSGQGWQLQFDNCLPFLLEEEKLYFIPKLEYHRLIKGATPLKIIINSNKGN